MRIKIYNLDTPPPPCYPPKQITMEVSLPLITKDYQGEIQKLKDSNAGYLLYDDDQLIEIIKKKEKEAKVEAESSATKPGQENYQKERKDWEKFYQDWKKEKPDFSKVKIPPKPKKDNWRLIFIKQDLTINQAFDKCKELFNAWRYTEDLDKAITKNSRKPTTHYAIWVQNEEEPDTQYLGKSTKDADPDMKIGVTLLERLILELKYYEETKKHLDIKGITFCTGSRDSDGLVPDVSWCGDDSRLRVSWYSLGHCYPKYGLRRAVSF